MTQIDPDAIVNALVNMRAMLIHRMRAPHCSPMMYNEIRSHVQQIDAQLVAQKYQGTLAPFPVRTWTRKQLRQHRHAAGNSFSQRMTERAGNVVKK